MSLTAAAIRVLADKGLSAADIADIAEANMPARSSGAARQQRYRDNQRNKRDVTRDVTHPLNEDNSNPPVPQSANADCPPLAEKVVLAWNAMATANGLSQSRKLNPKRRAALTARVREHGEPAIFEAIANVGRSDWHCGRKTGSDWKADLGWLLTSPEKFQKLLEMAGPSGAAAAPAPREAFEALCDREIERWRNQGNEREALAWERKKRGEEPQRESTGPPRSIGALTAQIVQQVAH